MYGVAAARDTAADLLELLPERWHHSAGVARFAARLTPTLAPGERDLLLIAAWLHDIGYRPAICRTGFHPLDGALFLRGEGWPAPVCALVAHHSGARYIAAHLGLGTELDQFAFAESPLTDALTYADQRVGPGGRVVTIDDRIRDTLRRHGPGSGQARAAHLRTPAIYAVAGRVERRLHQVHAATGHVPAQRGPDRDAISA